MTSVDVVALNSTGITGRIVARKEIILSAGRHHTIPTLRCVADGKSSDGQGSSAHRMCSNCRVGRNRTLTEPAPSHALIMILSTFTGIGNAEILRNSGIEPLIDLPGVGENLQVRIQSRPGHCDSRWSLIMVNGAR